MAEERKTKEFIDTVVDVRRVTKVTKGGKRFSFSAFVVSGTKEGYVGYGLGKSNEAVSAIAKATAQARKNMVSVPLNNTTIPYPVTGFHGATKVILRSAYKGTGVIAGGPVRAVVEAVGITDILSKTFGAKNKINMTKATLNALAKLRTLSHTAHMRGKSAKEIIKGSHVSA